MKLSVLERMLHVERHRRKMGEVGFIPPVAIRFPSGPESAPWVTSLSTGTFSLTRPNREGMIGHALVECLPDEEDDFLGELYRILWAISERHGWGNRCSSIQEALERMLSFKLEPKTLAIPYATVGTVVGTELSEEEADKVTLSKGCVAEVNGVRVLSARSALPNGCAILATIPALVGHYTRISEWVGVTITQADRSLVLVGNAVA